MTPQPTNDALKLAGALYHADWIRPIGTPGTLAEFIDRELALPQRNAALLLAQGVCEEYNPKIDSAWMGQKIDALREALGRIQTKP